MFRKTIATLTAATLVAGFTLRASAKDPDGSPKFESTYTTALEKAKAEDKPLLVIFSASWCGPCQANKKNVYPSEAVKPYHDKFVWAYLDTDDKGNAKTVKDFKVTGIPHIEFVGGDGKSLGKTVGGTNPAAFAKQLDKILAKSGKSEKSGKSKE